MTAVDDGVAAVIFDWGGTLTPWHTIDLAEQWTVYAAAVHRRRPERVRRAAAALHEAENAAWAASRDEQTSSRLADILTWAGMGRHEAGELAYRQFWEPHTLLDPQVPALFSALRERGVRVGVLSNTIWDRRWHEEIFARDGVLDLIDGAVYTSEVPWTKPHREVFRAAMAAVGVADPGACVFVGDRPYDDISGAVAAGMRAVLVPHSDIPSSQQVPVDVEPDAVVQQLGDLLPIVDGWRRGGPVTGRAARP